MALPRINQRGITHTLLIVGVVVVVAIGGIGVYVSRKNVSHAGSLGCNRYTYRSGSRGQCVKNIQTITNFRRGMNGYKDMLTVDGSYGPKTTAAVKGMQSLMVLRPDGVWGPKTWAEECTWFRQQLGNINRNDYYFANNAYTRTVSNYTVGSLKAARDNIINVYQSSGC